MKKLKKILLATALLAQGCAVAPLSNHITARTNGKGNSLLSAGSTIGVGNTGWVPSFKYSVGLEEKFDLGFQYEVIDYGAWAKYQFHGGKEGFAASGLVGLGASFDGYYTYLGPVLSWKMGIFEPYFVERFNYLYSPRKKYDVGSIGEIQVDPGTYKYFQHTLGFFLWPLDWLGFGLEASAFSPVDSSFILKGRDRYIFSGNFSFRF